MFLFQAFFFSFWYCFVYFYILLRVKILSSLSSTCWAEVGGDEVKAEMAKIYIHIKITKLLHISLQCSFFLQLNSLFTVDV